jgi:PhzF family phenazine biosynthesis protein
VSTIKRYQVDAFAENLFSGNPAVVCPLDSWLPDNVMQRIAMENNLSETAFYVREGEGFRIRWFTPAVEVDLCGHATLATAFVLFNYENFTGQKLTFQSRSGPLTVTKDGEMFTLDFPVDTINEVTITSELTAGFKETPSQILKGKTDYMFVFADEDQVKNCKPDFKKLSQLKARGAVITARGHKVDFVSRFFGPQSGIDEDPVTGSAHTTLTPYWASVLGKTELSAAQLSARGGKLFCKLSGSRVLISGSARLFSTGLIHLDGVK